MKGAIKIKDINILMKWDNSGMPDVVYNLFEQKGIKQNAITTITIKTLNKILKANGIAPISKNESEKVNIYFGFHHTSGHKTKIICDNDGNCSFEVISPAGNVFPAFWSEIIIFEYTGIDY